MTTAALDGMIPVEPGAARGAHRGRSGTDASQA